MKTVRLLLVLCATLLAAATVQAQETASVSWALTEAEGTSVTSTTGAATGLSVRSSQLEVRDYTGFGPYALAGHTITAGSGDVFSTEVWGMACRRYLAW